MNQSKSQLTRNTSVLFVTFSKWANKTRMPTNGSVEPLRDFLVPKIKKLVIIDQLHPGSDDVMPVIEEYFHQSLRYKLHHSSWWLYLIRPILVLSKRQDTQIRFKIRDFLSVLDWAMRDKTFFDYFIGLESVNTIAGILLRKLNRVKKVVYYVSDYSPNRYPNKLFNWIYILLDRFCASNADYIWDVSKAMQPARIGCGLDPNKSAPVIHVPNGLFPDQIKIMNMNKIHHHGLVYMGTLGKENGPDIAIKALSRIKKKYADAKLHIVGGMPEEYAWLQSLTEKLRLKDSVIYHGFIPRAADMSSILGACAIGLAPYRNFKGSIRLYGDAGKLRAYCAVGLPIITTKVPPLGEEVAKIGAALIVDDTEQAFESAIDSLFSKTNEYRRFRQAAIKFAKSNLWENQFENAFRQISMYE